MTLRGSQEGQGLAEYLVIVVLVAILVIVGVRYFSHSVTGQFQDATTQLTTLGDKSKSGPNQEPARAEQYSAAGRAGGGAEQTTVLPRNDAGGTEGKQGQRGDGGGGGKSGGVGGGTEDLHPEPVGQATNRFGGDVPIDWSSLFLFSLCVIAVGLYAMSKLLKSRGGEKDKKDKKGKKAGVGGFAKGNAKETGQAIVEFLLVSITFLFVILGVLQLALALNAYALVRYAAYNAARAAIVHQGDHSKMMEAARISLLATFPQHGRADHRRGFTENYLAAKLTDSNPALTYYHEPITDVKILGSRNKIVTFDDPTQANDGVITVQVVHQYELVLPLVNRIIFYVYTLWRGEGGYGNRSIDRMLAETDTMRRGSGEFHDIEYRIPLVAHYTMRMQSDLPQE